MYCILAALLIVNIGAVKTRSQNNVLHSRRPLDQEL